MNARILWAASLALTFVAPAMAELPDFTDALVKGHVDAPAAGYSADWTLGIDDKAVNPLQGYAPDTTILVVRPEARTTRPAGSQWDFLGAPAGAPMWLLPQTNAPNRLYLGANAESVPTGTLAAYSEADLRVSGLATPWVTMQVVDVRGPGAFSIWTTGAGGGTTIWVSTADGGLSASDKLLLLEDGHSHFNWGFTALGVYEVDVVVSGILNDGLQTPVASEVQTYYFGVEHSKAGDANLDGLVTGADYTIWADNFGQHPGDALFTEGDFNGDGFVTGADYTLWADHFDPPESSAVPEPAGCAMALFGGAALWALAQQKRPSPLRRRPLERPRD